MNVRATVKSAEVDLMKQMCSAFNKLSLGSQWNHQLHSSYKYSAEKAKLRR